MGFNAGTSVEPLDYDFTAYGGKKATIPEPTTAKIKAYFKEIQEFAKEFKILADQARKADSGEMDPEDVASILDELDKLDFEASIDNLIAATSRLCSNKPTEAEIKKLPYRVQQAFLKWIGGEFRPEGRSAG